jgi:hypothetical protein
MAFGSHPDGVGFFGAEAAQTLRAWLGVCREAMQEDYLLIDRGHQLVQSTAPGKRTMGLLEERRHLYEREARASDQTAHVVVLGDTRQGPRDSYSDAPDGVLGDQAHLDAPPKERLQRAEIMVDAHRLHGLAQAVPGSEPGRSVRLGSVKRSPSPDSLPTSRRTVRDSVPLPRRRE